MKVKELIEKLVDLPQDYEIYISFDSDGELLTPKCVFEGSNWNVVINCDEEIDE
ncbi:TPA: hypothetical protein JRX92_003522 [Elizabethkingia anophelis]|nr:hypothetical protein [Elizabethkingia anophelis]